MNRGRPPKDVYTRFWEKLSRTDDSDCWIWSGAISSAGYGVFTLDGTKSQSAHRACYELFIGPIPDGADIHHKCHNRRCVRPLHLCCASRDEHAAHHVKDRTHCINNHCYEEVGFAVVTTRGKKSRQCNRCRQDNWRKTSARRSAERAANRKPFVPRTKCRKGHDYTPENTAYSNGKRTCKKCWDEAKERYKAKHKSPVPRGTPKPFCKHGHAMTKDNTYTYKGRRSCKRCANDRSVKSRANRHIYLDMAGPETHNLAQPMNQQTNQT